MEKRKWLWKKKSSEKSPGETESSESISSHSERYSDDQEAMKESPNDNSQSPEVTSKASVVDEEVNKSVKSLAEKLSAALVNVSAKEDLVKQHAKVAEEAVAGWEKAENELAAVKQQLDASVQKNVALEDRVSHLDGALKECVRQLRQSKDEQEKKINEAILEKTREWEITKLYLESQLLELNTQPESTETDSPPPINPELHIKLESLEKENAVLKLELLSQSEELEIRTIERDLSIHAAETASKQYLESIKKVAKLETECRRLQAVARKPSLVNDRNARAGSITDSHSDSGDRLNECEPSLSDSWASALIAELDQFKNDQAVSRNSITRSFEVDVMDDFLEMERIAALPELESKKHAVESTNDEENALRTELETMVHKMTELEEKLKKVETEKLELENALTVSEDSLKASQIQLLDAEMRLEELQRELCSVSESKELLEFQLVTMEVEARTMSANVDLLKEGVEKERSLSAEMAARCQKLEDELMRKTEEVQLQQSESSKAELKIKQEDIAAASEKLAECQKTIASLGRQLNSLATLEDFLIDTVNLPGFSGGRSPVPGADGELWKLHTNDTYTPKVDSEFSKVPGKTSCSSMNGNDGESLASSSSSSSTSSSASLNRGSSSKSCNGFGKLFSRSKSGIQVENQQG